MAGTGGMKALLEIALQALPLHAEEGPQRESTPEADLVTRLAAAEGSTLETAALLAALLRRIMQALALLDPVELSGGRWAFVSFPASLLGRSLLETLRTPGQSFFPADYWEEGDYRPPALKEEQRHLLQRIESERVHSDPAARPIRVVHVAWAVIRVQDLFLMCRREDIARPGEKTHVLPGGRLNVNDLPHDMRSEPDVLRRLLNPQSSSALDNLHATLARELREELQLLPGTHYTAEPLQDLKPYCRVSGTGNRHVYTEYRFRLYSIRLTSEGDTRLLEQELAGALRPTWFSADEIAAPQRGNGDSAYVDVLHAAWGTELRKKLLAFPKSIDAVPSFSSAEPLDLPNSPTSGINFGKPGKERRCSVSLGETAYFFLLILGGHAKGWKIRNAEGIILLGRGWLKVTNERLLTAAIELQEVLSRSFPGLLEIREAAYVRLNAHPDALLFAPEWFAYDIHGSSCSGGHITVRRRPVDTSLGLLEGDLIERQLNSNSIRILRELERGDEPSAADGIRAADWEKNLREQLLSELRRLGLRRLWTTRQGTSTLVEGIRRSKLAF